MSTTPHAGESPAIRNIIVHLAALHGAGRITEPENLDALARALYFGEHNPAQATDTPTEKAVITALRAHGWRVKRGAPGTLIRETCGYRVYDNGRNSIIITAKGSGYSRPRMSLFLGRDWDQRIWRQLKQMGDTSFDGSCCLELGIGALMA